MKTTMAMGADDDNRVNGLGWVGCYFDLLIFARASSGGSTWLAERGMNKEVQ